MVHVIYPIVSRHQADLIQARRQIVVPYLVVIASLAILVAVGELANVLKTEMSVQVSFLHSVLLATTALGFGLALNKPIPFFERISNNNETNKHDEIYPRLLERLKNIMEQGAYREEGLRVGALALKLRIPEHRLRIIINRELGYRNFSSFLNEYRIQEAKQILSSQNDQKRQIVQIAYSLGYQSIGPFNRAFKVITGLTPSAYRNAKLNKIIAQNEQTSDSEY